MRKTIASTLFIGLALLGSATAQNNAPEGFTALFNGKDLKGWFGHGTKDPRSLWKMSPEALAAHQKKTLEDINAHWSVENGELVNDGHGLYLTTLKNYGDFELHLEYKTVAKADSGIYLRGCPQVQIWDTTEEAKFKLGADKGSGGLWNNSDGTPGKNPSKKMDKPFGEWNKMAITMIGERVTVVMNGEQIVDNAVMENYFDRKNPIFKEGPIQLQTHGGEIRWRNVFIREIDAEAANKHASQDGEGYKTLFNGTDLEGWQGAVDNHEVKDGAIVLKKGKGGTLYSKDEYTDFSFRFEFKLPPGGNNGVAARYSGKGDPAWDAFEIQTLDNTSDKYNGKNALIPYQYHGSIYGLVPAKRGYLRPLGEWNNQEIIFKGSHVKIILNGWTIVDKDLSTIDLSKVKKVPKGVERTKGYIGFAGHGDPVQMRNVRIKSL